MSGSVRKLFLDFFVALILIAAVWTAALGVSVLLWKTVEGATAPQQSVRIQEQRIEEARIRRIHSAIEKMVQNPAMLKRVKEKLRTFDEEKLRLIDSLCLRMTGNGGDPGADMAFLLVTGLIVL